MGRAWGLVWLLAMGCGGKDDDTTPTDAADTDTDADADTDADTDTDTDTDTEGCGATPPRIDALSASPSYGGGEALIEVVLDLSDADGDLHEGEVQAWYDELPDGVVDTSGGARLVAGFSSALAPCEGPAVRLTLTLGLDTLGLPAERELEFVFVVVDAAGNVSNGELLAFCTPSSSGGPGDCRGLESGETGLTDTGLADTGLADTGLTDTGLRDTHSVDTGSVDTGPADTGSADTGSADTGSAHTGDTGPRAGDTGP